MKNKIILFMILAATVNYAYAVDVSYETGTDQSIKKDKSMSAKN